MSLNHFVKRLLSTAFLTFSVAHSALAGEWKNVGPVESGDMKAFIDYQVSESIPAGDVWHGATPMGPSSYQSEARPIWVNVLRQGLSADDHVHVLIINYLKSCHRGDCSNTQELVDRELNFAEAGRFTAEFSALTLSYQLNDGYALTNRQAYAQEIVIWINGNIYKASNGRNLTFQWAR